MGAWFSKHGIPGPRMQIRAARDAQVDLCPQKHMGLRGLPQNQRCLEFGLTAYPSLLDSLWHFSHKWPLNFGTHLFLKV